MDLSTKQEHTDIKNRLVVAKRKGEGVGWTGNLGLVDANYYINNKVLLYSTGNHIQSPGIDHDGK